MCMTTLALESALWQRLSAVKVELELEYDIAKKCQYAQLAKCRKNSIQ